MSIRKRLESWSETPATSALAASWALVYVAMLVSQAQGWTPGPDARVFRSLGPLGIGGISEATGQVFGAWNTAQILSGQIWRTVTATFVHFGLVHIALNLFGLIQLGRFIEQWYGPKLLIAVVVGMGFIGNGLAALARPLVGNPTGPVLIITSGGGSTVIFGLIGLVAMVGKRSRSRMGRYLYNQMIGLLAFNFMIGLTIPQIDNYAHAGGAIAGAIVGRFHKSLLAIHDHKPRLCNALFAVALMVIGIGANGQFWVAKVEEKKYAIKQRVMELGRVGMSLAEVQTRYTLRTALGLQGAQLIPPKGRFNLPGTMKLILPIPASTIEANRMALHKAIEKTGAEVTRIGSQPLSAAWHDVSAQARLAVSRPPSSNDVQPFMVGIKGLENILLQEIDAAKVQYENTAKRLVLWRTPWPNIVWTPIGPALKSGIGPNDPRVGRLPDGSTGLPTGQPRVMPRPSTPPPQSGNEVAD